MAENSGIKTVTRLRKYINGKPTRETKPNTVGDPDYIAPVNDSISCPIILPPVAPPPSAPPPVTGPPVAPPPTAPPPVFVVTEEVGPEVTSCSECSTTVVEDKVCKGYLGINESNDSDISFQIKDCNTGEWVTRYLKPTEEYAVKSLVPPKYNSGPGKKFFRSDETGDIDTFDNVDINKYHYLASNCFNNKENRYVRHTSQLEPGNVVKTEHSTCCWHIDEQTSPTKAFDIVVNTGTLIYNNCNDCCTGVVSEPSNIVVFTGNTSASANCSNSVIQSSVFNVTSAGNVIVVFRVNTITGQYSRGTGRLLKVGSGIAEKMTSFPINPYGYPPYIENKKEDDEETEVVRIVNLTVGTYRLEVDPLTCASGAFGTASLTVLPQLE